MGNTIRREPVSFDLPKTPDYRHLNITNFRGLDVSSNPFELDSNTASDCLNVYVDESNTLTTRPRLQKKYSNLLDVLGENWEPIGYYRLHNGYLLHGKLLSGKYVMKLFIETEKDEYVDSDKELLDVNPVSPLQIPTNKCKVFEQGDTIYLLTGTSYCTIYYNTNSKKYVFEKVVGYVPVTATVDIDGNRNEVAPINLLINEYKEKHYWDGTWNPNTYSNNTIDATNETIVTDYITTSNFKSIKKLSQLSTPVYDYWYGIDDEKNNTGVLTINKKTKRKETIEYDNYDRTDLRVVHCDATADGRRKCVVVKNINDNTYHVYVKDADSDLWRSGSLPGYNTSSIGGIGSAQTFTVTSSKKYFWFAPKQINYATTTQMHSINADVNIQPNDELFSVKVNEDESLIVAASHDNKDVYASNRLNVYEFDTKEKVYKIKDLILDVNQAILDFDVKGNSVVVSFTDGDSELYYYPDVTQDGSYRKIVKPFNDEITKVAITDKFIYALGRNLTLINKTDLTVVWTQPISEDVLLLKSNTSNVYADNTTLETPNKNNSNTNVVWRMSIDYKNFVTITEKLVDDKDWQEKRDALLKSYINTRFDNNYWFASGNRYYRSRNNDPTYFPITEYNDLGDSNLPITGFNLANDTTLIAYKDDRLYLVQPFETSSGAREYSITESKNTVGNTAIDAPIVTTLTEIPLQINYDGVYGLSQLSNVSATERIADLMSRPINQRWLDIPDTLIKKAKTLNRLYWTYIIIPDNDYTQIYLLDNRTNSWYYWELPIVVADSFVVDNRTEFADKNGEIYYLTTTDIDVPNFGDVLITEYYDDGEKLIDWYWQSQIMHLGTINYTKRLINTTFILTDDDTTDGYGLKYGFKVFRKLASSVADREISNDINLVRSTTQKTNISKFGFLQMKISNITSEDRGTEARKEFRNNKLRLVGLGLKYVLLEGMIK